MSINHYININHPLDVIKNPAHCGINYKNEIALAEHTTVLSSTIYEETMKQSVY